MKKGYKFESETDTEVVIKLVKYLYDKHKNEKISFQKLIEMTCSQLVITFVFSSSLYLQEIFLGRCFCITIQKCSLSR